MLQAGYNAVYADQTQLKAMFKKLFSIFKKTEPKQNELAPSVNADISRDHHLSESSPKQNRLVLDADARISCNGFLTQTFGIRIADGSIAPFSKIGDIYPARGSFTFSTAEDFQDQITVEFHRSAEPVASDASLLGAVRISGYELEKEKEPSVRVHFEVSDDQIVIWATNEKQKSDLTLRLIKNSECSTVH